MIICWQQKKRKDRRISVIQKFVTITEELHREKIFFYFTHREYIWEKPSHLCHQKNHITAFLESKWHGNNNNPCPLFAIGEQTTISLSRTCERAPQGKTLTHTLSQREFRRRLADGRLVSRPSSSLKSTFLLSQSRKEDYDALPPPSVLLSSSRKDESGRRQLRLHSPVEIIPSRLLLKVKESL